MNVSRSLVARVDALVCPRFKETQPQGAPPACGGSSRASWWWRTASRARRLSGEERPPSSLAVTQYDRRRMRSDRHCSVTCSTRSLLPPSLLLLGRVGVRGGFPTTRWARQPCDRSSPSQGRFPKTARRSGRGASAAPATSGPGASRPTRRAGRSRTRRPPSTRQGGYRHGPRMATSDFGARPLETGSEYSVFVVKLAQ